MQFLLTAYLMLPLQWILWWRRQKHCCFVYFPKSLNFGRLFVQVMDTVVVKPLSPFTYKRRSQQSVFMQLWFTPKRTRTVTKFKVINVKNDVYKIDYSRRSCTSETTKIRRFVILFCNVLFHHYTASSILLSM